MINMHCPTCGVYAAADSYKEVPRISAEHKATH